MDPIRARAIPFTKLPLIELKVTADGKTCMTFWKVMGTPPENVDDVAVVMEPDNGRTAPVPANPPAIVVIVAPVESVTPDNRKVDPDDPAGPVAPAGPTGPVNPIGP